MTVASQNITNEGRGSADDSSDTSSSSSSSSVLVLYKITNCKSYSSSPQYNAFQIPKQQFPISGHTKKAMTLSHVKQNMAPILQKLNEIEGCNGYHFRVLSKDSLWYDATKNSDLMPFQSYSAVELQELLNPTSTSPQSSSTGGGGEEGPKMDVLVLKLLDVTKLRMEECQRQMLRKKLKKMVGKTKRNTTQSEAGLSLLSSQSVVLKHVDHDENAAKEEGTEIILSLTSPSEDEKKEEEILPYPPVQLNIEDHPLAFACKPSMRESVLSSSLDTKLLEEAVEDEDEKMDEEEDQMKVDDHPLAFACKPALRESVLSTLYRRSSITSVEDAVELVLDSVSLEDKDKASGLKISTTTSSRSISPSRSTSPLKKQDSSKNSPSVTAKTTVVSGGQCEVECVLTRSPLRRNHVPTKIAKKAENKTPSSTVSSPIHKHHLAKISSNHHKNHSINIRNTSPTTSPTPQQRHDRTLDRSNSPSSVADFADPAPSPVVVETKSRQRRHSHLHVPDLHLGQPSFAMKPRSSSCIKPTTDLPLAGVATKMTPPPSQNPTEVTRLSSSAPPALRLHSGWEETLGLSIAAAAQPKVAQQSPPVHRKLSWEEAITGSTTPVTAVPPVPTQGYQPQQPSFTPHVPLTHCLV